MNPACRFEMPLIVTPLLDGKRWRLVHDLLYSDDVETIRVPKGFVTNFASTPRPIWAIIPPWGKYGEAAVLHDWLYARQERDRKAADVKFFEAMTCCDVNYVERWAIYLAVRVFGGYAWEKHRKKRHAA